MQLAFLVTAGISRCSWRSSVAPGSSVEAGVPLLKLAFHCYSWRSLLQLAVLVAAGCPCCSWFSLLAFLVGFLLLQLAILCCSWLNLLQLAFLVAGGFRLLRLTFLCYSWLLSVDIDFLPEKRPEFPVGTFPLGTMKHIQNTSTKMIRHGFCGLCDVLTEKPPTLDGLCLLCLSALRLSR